MKTAFARIPIFGALGGMSGSAIKEASVEMLITLLFSTLPIWFGGIILSSNFYFTNIAANARSTDVFIAIYCKSLFSTVANGELLMYAAATLGPTLYLGFSSFGAKSKPFPWVRPQLVIAILINLSASVLFFMARDKGYAGESIFVYTSLIFYLLSLVLLFPALAYAHEMRTIDPAELQREDQDEFMDGYRKRKERG
jgi:hypothetical protein